VGLCEIHGRGLVHGDIKPGNILINDNPLKVAIGDLGFVSLGRYAKVKYIAKVYRDNVIRQSPVHDMWSLGVLLLELFGRIRILEVCNSQELYKKAKRKIKDRKIRSIIYNLVDDCSEKRFTAPELLKKIFEEQVIINVKNFPRERTVTQCSKAFVLMRKCASDYRLAMIERCIKALKWYIHTHNIKEEDCEPYGIAMLLISSSLYRISKFDLKKAIEYSGLPKKDFLHYLCNLLANDDVINILFKTRINKEQKKTNSLKKWKHSVYGNDLLWKKEKVLQLIMV
jgi:serine/threonine protein kinase